MRLILNLLLSVVIIGLVYLLATSVTEPIRFKTAKTKRENAVVDKLIKIRHLQEMYRTITGEFAPSFDTLKQVLMNDSFEIVKVFGDPDDPDNSQISYDTIYKPAKDSVQALINDPNFKLNFDNIEYVPFADQEIKFNVWADTITYQRTTVPVVEVGIERKKFMGDEYSKPKYARYDQSYDPESTIKFGDRTKPNTSGNWER